MAPLPQVAFYAQQHGGMLNLQTKRGCSFRCVYCPYPHIEGRSHRLIPPESVAQTALELEAAGARYIFITDSAFNSHPSHSRAVARAFKTSRLRIPWGAFFAPLAPESGYFAMYSMVVVANPRPNSFVHALAEEAAAGLTEAGHEVVLHDL